MFDSLFHAEAQNKTFTLNHMRPQFKARSSQLRSVPASIFMLGCNLKKTCGGPKRKRRATNEGCGPEHVKIHMMGYGVTKWKGSRFNQASRQWEGAAWRLRRHRSSVCSSSSLRIPRQGVSDRGERYGEKLDHQSPKGVTFRFAERFADLHQDRQQTIRYIVSLQPCGFSRLQCSQQPLLCRALSVSRLFLFGGQGFYSRCSYAIAAVRTHSLRQKWD